MRRSAYVTLLAAALGLAAPGLGQAGPDPAPVTTVPLPATAASATGAATPSAPGTAAPSAAATPAPSSADTAPAPLPPKSQATFAQDDVLGAAEGVFGKGAEGLAEIVRKSFAQYGQPNAYIVGSEASGAFVFGLRYGSGTLFHKVEGQMPVHWTGPSVGFDVGGDGSKTFALVYNLYNTDDLFRRYPAAEGKAYLVGGFTANYLQRDDVIIVPIKIGVGWRLGVNAGYLKFSRKGELVPF